MSGDSDTGLGRLEQALHLYAEYQEDSKGVAPAQFLDEHRELRDLLAPMLLPEGAAREDEEPRTQTARDGKGDSTIEAPESIGPYRIVRILGRGGFGVVYLARQTHPITRQVALKHLKLGMDTQEALRRFEAEKDALARMNHPGIAKVHDAGCSDEGRPYFVMEYVAGAPLVEYCDEQRLDVDQRLELFLFVCEAVQHAHQKGIIHRDLKPNNILVTVEAGRPLPKIIDFGVSKAVDPRASSEPFATRHDQMLGTPEYMAPEQARWSGADVDTRADIYSLGVILYELLVGALPFDGGRTTAGSRADVERTLFDREAARPSTRLRSEDSSHRVAAQRRTTTAALLRRVRGDLDWIVLRALEKDRVRRYGTPSELAADLRRHLQHEPVLAGPPSTSYRLAKFLRRYKGPVAAVVLLVTLLTLSLVGMTMLYRDANEATRLAESERGRAQQQTELREREAELLRSERDAKALLVTAEQQARSREAGFRLLSESQTIAARNPGLALLLAVEGARRSPGLAADNALLAALHDCTETRTLAGHRAGVETAVFSPDGRRVATASADSTPRLWTLASGANRSLPEQSGRTIRLAFTPNGRRLLRAYSDIAHAGTGAPRAGLSAWNVLAARTAWSVEFETILSDCAMSDDGQHVAVAGANGEVVLLAMADGAILGNVQASPEPLHSVRFATGGERLVTASEDGTAYVFEVPSLVQEDSLRPGFGAVRYAEFSRDGRVLTVSALGVEIWRGSRLQDTLPFDDDSPLHAEFSPDGTRVLTTSLKPRAEIWDASKGEMLAELKGHQGRIFRARFDAQGRRVVTASADGTARVWDAERGTTLAILRGHASGVRDARFAPDGSRVCTVSDDTTARIWNPEGRRSSQTLSAQAGRDLSTAAISPGGRLVAAGCADEATVLIFDRDSRERPLELSLEPASTGGIRQVVFSPSGQRLLVVALDRVARIFDPTTGEELARLEGNREFLHIGAFSADETMVLTASHGRDVRWQLGAGVPSLRAESTPRLWNVHSGELIADLRGHGAGISSACFSHDGKLVVTASSDHTARVWSTETGEETLVIPHPDEVAFAEFGPDDAFVMTACVQGGATLWDALDGTPLVELSVTPGVIVTAALRPDGSQVLTLSADGSASVWETSLGESAVRLDGNFTAQPFAFADFHRELPLALTLTAEDAARLWNTDTGEEVMTLGRPGDSVVHATFSPAGDTVLTTTENKVRIWTLSPLKEAKHNLPRSLTPEERRRHRVPAVAAELAPPR